MPGLALSSRKGLCETPRKLLAPERRKLSLCNGRPDRYIHVKISSIKHLIMLGGFPERFFTNEVHPDIVWKAVMKENTLVCASTPRIQNPEKIGLYGIIQKKSF